MDTISKPKSFQPKIKPTSSNKMYWYYTWYDIPFKCSIMLHTLKQSRLQTQLYDHPPAQD